MIGHLRVAMTRGSVRVRAVSSANPSACARRLLGSGQLLQTQGGYVLRVSNGACACVHALYIIGAILWNGETAACHTPIGL